MTELTRTVEYLAYTEDQAYDFIAEKRKEEDVLSSSVKFKRATKKTEECWIVTIKTKINELKDLISMGEE